MIGYQDVVVGAELTASRTITESDIARCAELTGDFGAHHIAGLEGRPIAQGLLTAAITPLLRGDPGFHLRTMSMTFLAPVYAGDTVTAAVRIVGSTPRPDGGVDVDMQMVITKQDGTPVITATSAGFLDGPTA